MTDALNQIPTYESVIPALSAKPTPAEIRAAEAKIAAQRAGAETIKKQNDTSLDIARNTAEQNLQDRLDKLDLDKSTTPEPVEEKMPEIPHYERDRSFMIKATVLTAISIAGAAYMQQGAEGAAAILTGAMNGLMAGDHERYNRELIRYHDRIKMIHAEYDRREKAYNNLMKQKDRDRESLFSEMRHLRLAYGDQRAQNAKSLEELEKLAAIDQNQINRLLKANEDMAKLSKKDNRTAYQKERAGIEKEYPKQANETQDEYEKRINGIYAARHPKGNKGAGILSALTSQGAGNNGDFTIVRKQ